MYIIQNIKNDLYWSNDIGWVSRPDATLFKDEAVKFCDLPIDGKWVALNKLILTEDQITDRIFDWLHECDAFELAHTASDIFGGKITPILTNDNNEYELIPDQNYMGAFDKA